MTTAGELAAGVKLASAGIETFKLAHRQGWLDGLRTLFRKRQAVLVLGSTGVGKTNLIGSLTELLPAAIHHMTRTEFAARHKLRIGSEPFVFIDVPGSTEHRPRRVKAIREAMATGTCGVINVTAYGYHEWKIGSRTAVTTEGQVIKTFLKHHRGVEIAALPEWAALLGDVEAAAWLMTVVSKADLWWDQRDKVLTHYRDGAYAKAMKEAAQQSHTVLEYCAVFHKFYSQGRLSGHFDEHERARVRAQLFAALLAAAGRGRARA